MCGRKRAKEYMEDSVGCLHDIHGGELEDDLACLLEVIATSSVVASVGVGGMTEASTDLDDHACAGEAEVDAGDARSVRTEYDLRFGPRETGSPHELEESPFEVRLAATVEEQFPEPYNALAA